MRRSIFLKSFPPIAQLLRKLSLYFRCPLAIIFVGGIANRSLTAYSFSYSNNLTLSGTYSLPIHVRWSPLGKHFCYFLILSFVSGKHFLISFLSLNRFSMPVNSSRQPQRLSMGNSMQPNGLGPLNTTSFLFDDNDDKHLSLNGTSDLSSPIAKAFMQLGGDDMFPTLRSNGTSGIVSSTLGALTESK